MEKEEAMKILKEFHDKSALFLVRTALDTVIPELKESDERIRRIISGWIYTRPDSFFDNGISKEDILAWVEKQGVHKYIDPDTLIQQRVDALADIVAEKTPTNKVEPKFHEGDWIVKGDTIAQILDIQEQYYIGLDINGKDFTSSRFLSDDKIHLWTIQDANKGDVLVHNDCTFIFMGVKNGIVQAFEENSLDGANPVCFGEPNRDGDYHPATKEQRDLLFQKMKEAGYEWDAEKKELKKIIEEVNGKDYGIDGLWHAQTILEKTLGRVEGYQSDDGILEHKAAITAVKKLYEQKPAEWSEEDKKMFVNIKACLRNANKDYSSELDWLKSLRPQNVRSYNPYKAVVESIAEMCEKYKGYVCAKEVANDFLHNVFAKCHEAVEYDKKYPQKQWKPSDEHIHRLKWAIHRMPDTEKANEAEAVLEDLLEQLKKL